MSAKPRKPLSEADYEAMADDYAENPVWPTELIGPVELIRRAVAEYLDRHAAS